MSATTDTGRSLLGEALHWALPRLAGYVLAALGAMLAFIVWAVIYTYVWPGKPPAVSIEAPQPVVVPTVPADEKGPLISKAPDPLPALVIKPLSQVPSDVLPSLRNVDIYDPSDAKVGQIKDVLVSYDGALIGYIIGVGDGFLGGQGKNIAVPSQAVGFPMKSGRTSPVLFMTKDAVQSAPKQKFDQYKMNWVPDTAP